jgi:hypothetical protein
MIDNETQVAENIEEVEVEITDNVEETPTKAVADDELDKYTKGVSKRINKKNQQLREAQNQNAELMQRLHEAQTKAQSYQKQVLEQQQNIIEKEQESIAIKEREADELYKKAHESGDAALISKADSLKNEVSIKKEQVRIAAQRQQEAQNSEDLSQPVQQPTLQQAPVQAPPSPKASAWHAENSWYGEIDASGAANPNFKSEPSQYAYFTHMNLVSEGYEPDSDEYYDEINRRVYKVYPELNNSGAEQSEERPAVQRVASASVGGRQQTQGKKNGVSFSKAEVQRLKGLKPHGMSDEAWLKSVAKEKQLISTREAK